MGKSRRSGDKQMAKKVAKMTKKKDDMLPDSNASSYYQDDIDTYFENKDKILLDNNQKAKKSAEINEVLAFEDSSDDDDKNDVDMQRYKKQLKHFKREMFKEKIGSDLEDGDEEDDEQDPNQLESWGREKRHFYGVDINETKRIKYHKDEFDEIEQEEQEALAIQNKMVAELDEEDFGLDIFETSDMDSKPSEETLENELTVEADLSTLTQKEKRQLLKRQAPEMLELIQDYKSKMTVVIEQLAPLLNLVNTNKIPQSSGSKYIYTKMHLYLNYCVNISFYMKLKAEQIPVHNHPIIKRLLQYRNLIKQLEPADLKIQPEMDRLLKRINKSESMDVNQRKKAKKSASPRTGEKRTALAKKAKTVCNDKSDESDSGSSIEDLKAKEKNEELQHQKKVNELKKTLGQLAGVDVPSDEELEKNEEGDYYVEERNVDTETGKRNISRDIAVNKGLVKKRKKEESNPRVKLRRKHRRAVQKHKAQVRQVQREINRYSGENRGISASVVKSTRF